MLDQAIERELVRQTVAGDRNALERLLLAYYDRLAARIARKVPASLRSVVSEEDVLQQTFISAFQSLSTFEPQGAYAFYRWLCTVAEHRLQDAIKAQRAQKRGGGLAAAQGRQPSFAESMQEMIEVLAGPGHTPSQSVARHEAARAVEVGLTRISEDHRRALELRYVRGLPVAEIAEAMNRTERAVHNLCHRGLRELYAVMGESVQFFSKR